MDWNVLDVLFAAIVLFFAVRGVFRGFIGEVFAVGALVAGVGAAVLFSGALAGTVEKTLGISGWGYIVAFIAIFLVVYIAVKILQRVFKSIIEGIHLEGLDKALGLFLGLAEGLVLVGFVVFLLRNQRFVDVRDLLGGSVVARVITPLVVTGAEAIKSQLK